MTGYDNRVMMSVVVPTFEVTVTVQAIALGVGWNVTTPELALLAPTETVVGGLCSGGGGAFALGGGLETTVLQGAIENIAAMRL